MSAGTEEVRQSVLEVNFATWTVNGQRMSRSDHALLQVFIERAGEVITKRELWNAFWGSVPQNDYGRFTSRALEAAVSRLRRKGVPLINIWGVGWLLPEDIVGTPAQLPSVQRANGDADDALDSARRVRSSLAEHPAVLATHC